MASPTVDNIGFVLSDRASGQRLALSLSEKADAQREEISSTLSFVHEIHEQV